jgi:hypothetical protein
VVVTGTITSIEKELVDAAPQPGAAAVGHRIALVRIDGRLAGAANLTHLRVGFVPSVGSTLEKPRRAGRADRAPRLEVGREYLFFLAKHPAGRFYAIPGNLDPIEASAPSYSEQVEVVSSAFSAVAEPRKALTTGNAAERFSAALAIITRYRMLEGGRDVEAYPIPEEESRLILKALAEGDWATDSRGIRLSGFVAIYRLGLSESDGWKAPPGKGGEEYTETVRKAFIAWLEGPGKDYTINRIERRNGKSQDRCLAITCSP